jgi:flagellar hook-associated protein FlgK
MSSVLSISAGGMNAAIQRMEASARNIANPSNAGELGQDAIELMMARIGFEANARVAQTATRTLDRLLDITV